MWKTDTAHLWRETCLFTMTEEVEYNGVSVPKQLLSQAFLQSEEKSNLALEKIFGDWTLAVWLESCMQRNPARCPVAVVRNNTTYLCFVFKTHNGTEKAYQWWNSPKWKNVVTTTQWWTIVLINMKEEQESLILQPRMWRPSSLVSGNVSKLWISASGFTGTTTGSKLPDFIMDQY